MATDQGYLELQRSPREAEDKSWMGLTAGLEGGGRGRHGVRNKFAFYLFICEGPW